MKEKMIKFRNFIKDNGYEGTQTFSARNISGDVMKNVYAQDGIYVDYCEGWHYLEIFGLTEDEYNSLSDILDI